MNLGKESGFRGEQVDGPWKRSRIFVLGRNRSADLKARVHASGFMLPDTCFENECQADVESA